MKSLASHPKDALWMPGQLAGAAAPASFLHEAHE